MLSPRNQESFIPKYYGSPKSSKEEGKLMKHEILLRPGSCQTTFSPTNEPLDVFSGHFDI